MSIYKGSTDHAANLLGGGKLVDLNKRSLLGMDHPLRH